MADDYTPSEARVCIDYCNAAVARREADPVIGMAEADAEFDRFIEAVKRDAARSALDGLACKVRRLIPEADPAQQDRMKYAAGLITAEAMNHPETEGQP